jgi:Flp pilus assembly protein TadD
MTQLIFFIVQEAAAHMNLGAMYHLNGKLKEAETSYLKALQLKPDDQMTKDNLAKLRSLIQSRTKKS